jgi:hypothetical protein|tara:strand:+ start:5213 stop:5533 length:321 start_codon:yes stop_codon:yes gene_type:complete
MAENKATEAALCELHGTVAKVLTSQIQRQEESTTFDADGVEVPTGEMEYVVAPATLATAIKFLKDNDITADREKDSNMGNLREALATKQKHSRLKLVDPEKAASEM